MSNKKSWPFKWSNTHKWLRKKLDVAVDLTPGTDKPLELMQKEYEALLSILPKDFIVIGKPLYRGREIIKKQKVRK